ncbi:MAG TPA: ABC transporter permease, partial [Opitutaceae bacterium]|nr:ABC transporter permease [Opitutaceae bacterium]
RKAPGFVAVVVLTLALGIGATTTVFCWRENMRNNPVPGSENQSQLRVLLTERGASRWHTVSPPDLRDARELHEIFSGIIGSQTTPACVSIDAKPSWLYGQIVTANFFSVLGVRPVQGRTFHPEEDAHPGGDNVVVLGERCWRRRFAADPHIVGRTIEINRHPFTVIGVVPESFQGTMSGLQFDFWTPVSMHHEVANFGSLAERNDRWLHTQVRLAPGVDDALAQTALDTLSSRLAAEYPNTNHGIGLRLVPFAQAPYGAQPILLPVLRVLLVVCFGVLLICAANIANLLLARATARQREIGIRLAIGAGRLQIVRLLLAESLWLVLAGGLGGLVLSSWFIELLAQLTPPSHLPVRIANEFSLGTYGFAAAITLGAGVLFSLVPAWQSARTDLNHVLKDGGRNTVSPGQHVLRRLLVVTEIALALTLLVGASLCVRSVVKARRADLGLDTSNLLLAGLRIGMHGYTEPTGMAFYAHLQQEVATLPGVVDAALASTFPLGLERGPQSSVLPEGYQPQPNEDLSVPYAIVSPRFFSTLRTPLLAGRDFNDLDDGHAQPVAIINEALAQRFWPGVDPVGRRFRAHGKTRTVIGVVRTATQYAVGERPQEFFYLPYRQGVWDLNLGICVRTAGEPLAALGDLRNAIHRLDPAVELWSAMPMREYMQGAFLAHTFATKLLFALGGLALLLAAMGVYAVMAYAVNQRRGEFGVRMALGAAGGDVLRLVLRQGLALAAIGVAAGLVLATSASHLLAGLLYGVGPFDPVSFTAIPLLLTGVAVAASWLPAHRATKVDPNEALRAE